MDSLKNTARIGIIAGLVALSVSMIGMVEKFTEGERYIIFERMSLAQLLLYSAPLIAGYMAVRNQERSPLYLAHGLISGFLATIPIFLLILLTGTWETIRDSFINVSPDLINILTFGNENSMTGSVRLFSLFAVMGIIGSILALPPKRLRNAIINGLLWAIGIGLMAEILENILKPRLESDTMDLIFGKSGFTMSAFLVLFSGFMLYSFLWQGGAQKRAQRFERNMPQSMLVVRNMILLSLVSIFVTILPSLTGVYLTEITNVVGLYVLMGLGLNIAVGMAGLLDLGYVTNFAVGAYVMALLTSTSEFGLENPVSFWVALPICVLAAMFTGFIFALPVLRMRGDYLAIATLGFGEIVRVLAKSDAMKGVIGGAQGILQIPKPSIGGGAAQFFGGILASINGFLERWDLSVIGLTDDKLIFNKPPELFYLVILACLLMLFVSRRLNNSSIGRRWAAMREDEDVAAAMGINTTNAKVVAFTLSAASGGLAGAIFAAKLGSIFPSSFNLLISVNVLSLIIVGGLGSIVGVFVGAFALIGVPELLREFAEFRLLLYGVALIVMMLVRPEGLWPSEAQRRELRGDDDVGDTPPDVAEVVPAAGD